MSSTTAWIPRRDLDESLKIAEWSEYFTIRYVKVSTASDDGRTIKQLIGHIDWCHSDYISLLEIIAMGRALGLDEGNYTYFWRLTMEGEDCMELSNDTDVLHMASCIGTDRVVTVEARVWAIQPIETLLPFNEEVVPIQPHEEQVEPEAEVVPIQPHEEQVEPEAEVEVEQEAGVEDEEVVVEAGVEDEEVVVEDVEQVEEEAEVVGDKANIPEGVETEEDSDDSDLYDSDYEFYEDEEIDDDEISMDDEEVVVETEEGVETVEDHAHVQTGEGTSGVATEAHGNEGPNIPYIDCPSSEYEDSDQLHSEDDSDNEGVRGPRYPDFLEENMNNPKLEVGMKFSSFNQFKEACRNYGIRNRVVLSFNPNDKKRCKANCKKNCPFYLWAGFMSPDNPTVQIKSGILSHTCSRDHRIRHVNARWLAKEYIEQFRADPTWKLDGIMQVVRTNQRCEVSKVVAYRAKKAALEIINGDETEQISLLYDYRLELIRTHPSSTIMFKQEEGVFRGMYVCLAPLRDGFKDGCRNVISVDGCWLKGLFGMQLLTAVGIDANDCIYPVAWAIVDRENKENWKWFLELLGKDLEINHSMEWAFMSDRQKGLIGAIDDLFPHAEHRYCVRHILTNFRTRFKGKAMKDVLWKCARASYGVRFREELQVLQDMSPEAHEYLSAIDAEHWTRSHFDQKYKCDMLLNNLCECFNSFILDARTKGFITMNEMIRTLLMKRIQKKRAVMLRSKETFCPKIRKKLEKIKEISWYYRADWSGGDKYQVLGSDGQFVVDKREHTCTCRRWQLTGIPCHHAVAAMNANNEDPEPYLHNCYKVDTYLRIYSHFINPTNGKQLWPKSNIPPISAPEPVNLKRGRKTLLRRREAGEPERGGAGARREGGVGGATLEPVRVSRRGSQMSCSTCGGKGHNMRSCRGKKTATRSTPVQPTSTSAPQEQPNVMTQEFLASQLEILTPLTQQTPSSQAASQAAPVYKTPTKAAGSKPRRAPTPPSVKTRAAIRSGMVQTRSSGSKGKPDKRNTNESKRRKI